MPSDPANPTRPTGLAAEIGKRRPFELLEEEVYLNLLRTQERLSRPFAALFREHGLSEPKYNALRILRGHGAGGAPIQRIGAEMVASHPDITRLIDRLEADGLVERARDDGDRRRVIVRLTSEGRSRVDALDEPLARLHHSQFGAMSRDDLERLNQLLLAARASAAAATVPEEHTNGRSKR
ncbi:MAG: MarR family winged helix-turn-helix transcriptional regulator [Phycisphaerales bacterium]